MEKYMEPMSDAFLCKLSRTIPPCKAKQIAREVMNLTECDLQILEHNHHEGTEFVFQTFRLWTQRELHPGPTPQALLNLLEDARLEGIDVPPEAILYVKGQARSTRDMLTGPRPVGEEHHFRLESV